MDLPMNLVYDVALGLILLSILYRSWQQGFVASFIRMIGTAAGFLLASYISQPAAEKLYTDFLQERVERYVAETLLASGSPLMDALAGLDQAGSAALQLVADILAEQGLDFYSPSSAGQMGQEILARITEKGIDPATAIAQVAVKPLVMTVLQTAIFFVIVTLAGIATRVIARVGLGVNQVPLVGGVNRLAGLACGVVYGLLVGYVISSTLVLLAGLGGNRWEWLNSGILRHTVLVSRFLAMRTWRP